MKFFIIPLFLLLLFSMIHAGEPTIHAGAATAKARSPKIIEVCIKETEDQLFLVHRHALKGSPSTEIPAVINQHYMKMEKEVKSKGLKRKEITYNIYQDMSDKTKQSYFELAIPLTENPKEYKGNYQLKTYTGSRYLSVMVLGPNPEHKWGDVIELAKKKGYELTRIDMEVYYLFKEGENYFTELRLGIKKKE